MSLANSSTSTDITHSSGRARIVIVDDSRTQAAMLRQLLQQSGYEVFIAFDGKQALQAVDEHQPDVVIADIVMPVMDGYAMCQALKSDPIVAQTPVILLTALQDPTDIVRGLQAGADYYLTKPYQPDYLLATLEGVLSRPDTSGQNENALEVEVQGHRYLIRSGRQQMLNLLLSTYGSAVQQNQVLTQTQHKLRTLNEKLIAQQQQIEAQQRELRENNQRLKKQATRDSLTGLRNRRAIIERFHEEIERARRRKEPLSLALLDVDQFKLFNDTFGHPAGDIVLREVADLIESRARVSDLAARYGGEEFALLLPATDASAARLVTERVRESIANAYWPQRRITVSIGIATLTADALYASQDTNNTPAEGQRPTDAAEGPVELTLLLARADAALYASKHAGRNCTTHADDLI
ncbi:phytochrome-like protein cph2 [Abditibacteriota bacterium]|nr:phytochrome-like protein cph2 [Abditibacteriota bacterium]